jgi:3-oxoadipate enol-lactonase
MPDIEIDGARIWYSVVGPENAPAVLLLHSLGTTHELWDAQMPALQNAFRVVRYDLRGHGHSTAPPGDYRIDQLGRDALAVLDAAGVQRAAVCGISIGGLTSIWLGQQASSRVRRLVLANTAARIGSRESWSERIRAVREGGMDEGARLAMPRWFSNEFLESQPAIAARFREIVSSCPLESYVGACAALRDADLRRDLHRIMAPTLVISGSKDPSTTVSDAVYLRDNIPEADLEVLSASHLSNVERPDEFSSLLLDFLRS